MHYVAEGECRAAADTEFARDTVFGYQASDLRQWVAEKTGGRIPAHTVASVSLEDIRRGGPQQVMTRLMGLTHGCVCVVNAASQRDLEVFVQGLLAAEAHGGAFCTALRPHSCPSVPTSRPVRCLLQLSWPCQRPAGG